MDVLLQAFTWLSTQAAYDKIHDTNGKARACLTDFCSGAAVGKDVKKWHCGCASA